MLLAIEKWQLNQKHTNIAESSELLKHAVLCALHTPHSSSWLISAIYLCWKNLLHISPQMFVHFFFVFVSYLQIPFTFFSITVNS